MAVVFPIMVKVDPANARSGARQVERDLDKVKQKAIDVNRSIRQIFGVFAIRELATGLYTLVDGYTSLQNKLRVVSKDQANLNGLTRATFKIAQETRSSWESTATMYQRMALNSRQLGVSQRDLIGFTKSLNQAVIIGGATTTEAAAGLLQLSQGMASGALRGDELRAVLEQLPVVADVIAKKYNVTRGELRALGTAGKIAGRDIIEAFRDAAPELEKQFGKTVPTIAQSFEMLRNSAMMFFGDAGTGSGTVNTLALAIKFLADNMDTIGKVVLAVGQALLGLLLLRTIHSLVVALFTVIAAHPLTAFVIAITTVVLLLRQFGDQLDAGHDGVTKVSDVLRVLWEEIKILGAEIFNFLEGAWTSMTDAFSTGLETNGIEFSFKSVLMLIAAFVDAAIGMFKFLGKSVVTVFGGIPVVIGEVLIWIGQAIAKVFEDIINELVREINNLSDFFLGGIDIKSTEKALSDAKKMGLSDEDALQHVIDNTKKTHGPQLDKVDFSFSNPLEGAGKSAANKFLEDWADAVSTSTAKDFIATTFNKAAASALNRKNNETVGSTVLTDPSKFDAPGPTKAEQNAWEKLLRQLDALLKKSNEVREAQMRLAEAEKLLSNPRILEELQRRGLTAATVLADYREELSAALDPLGTWIDKTVEEIAAMKGSTAEYEHKQRVLEIVNDLTKKGVELKDYEIQQIERITKLQEERSRVWKIEQEILEQINGPTQKYRDSLTAIQTLLAEGRINAQQFNAAFEQITATFMSSNDAAYEKWKEKWEKANPFAAGWLDAGEKIQADMLGISTAVSDVMTTAFGNLEEFIIKSAESGKMQWDSLIEGMITALNKLALKILETWALSQLLNVATGGTSGAVSAAASGTTALSSSGMSGGSGIGSGKFWDWYGGAHATGGSYVVPGSGGPDSQRVLFDLTPGEHVSFTPPGQMTNGENMAKAVASAVASAMANAQGGSSGGRGVTVHNHIDRNELLSVVDTPEGEQKVVNVIRKNAGAIRSLLQK